MSLKAQILIVAMLLAGMLFAEIPDPSTPVADIVFTAFDTETSGFSPKTERVIEIAAVKFRGSGEILAATNWLINPEIPIPSAASRVHGITAPMVANAPVFKEVFPQFEAFCADSILLAHNAMFDINFLRAELKRNGMKTPLLAVFDTLPMFRKWFPHEASHSLGSLTENLGLAGDIYHRAEADSFHIINIFKAGMKQRPAITLEQMERDAGGFKRLNGGPY